MEDLHLGNLFIYIYLYLNSERNTSSTSWVVRENLIQNTAI